MACVVETRLRIYGAHYSLLNNARIYPRNALFDMPHDVLEQIQRINMSTPFRLVQAFVPDMIDLPLKSSPP